MKFKRSCYVPQGLVACHGFDMTVAIVKDAGNVVDME